MTTKFLQKTVSSDRHCPLQLESCANQFLWANREEIGEGTVSELSAAITSVTMGFKSLYGTTEMPVRRLMGLPVKKWGKIQLILRSLLLLAV